MTLIAEITKVLQETYFHSLGSNQDIGKRLIDTRGWWAESEPRGSGGSFSETQPGCVLGMKELDGWNEGNPALPLRLRVPRAEGVGQDVSLNAAGI